MLAGPITDCNDLNDSVIPSSGDSVSSPCGMYSKPAGFIGAAGLTVSPESVVSLEDMSMLHPENMIIAAMTKNRPANSRLASSGKERMVSKTIISRFTPLEALG